jgi:hypothetical protein
MNWIDDLKIRLFPPVSRRAALVIASKSLSHPAAAATLVCHGRRPEHFRVYGGYPEPCWWVEVPWADGKDGSMIRSSRVIAVGRRSGKVYYDGAAGDEG